MQQDVKEYLKSLSGVERLQFLSYLILHIGEAARAQYPPPSGQAADGYRQLRVFNEIYQEIAHQILGELESSEHQPLEVAVTETLRHHAAYGHLERHIEWAVNKAIEAMTATP